MSSSEEERRLQLLPAFVLFPSESGDAPPSLLPCFIPREHTQIAQLPDIVRQFGAATTPIQRRQPVNSNIKFQLHPDGTSTHESLENPNICENMLLPPVQLRVVRKEEPKETGTESGTRKVVRVYLTNGDEKTYQMTGWQDCADKLAALTDGAIYKFTGLKALSVNFGESDIGYRFGFGPRATTVLVSKNDE